MALPENKLFQAVLWQAVKDASTGINTTSAASVRDQARAWLSGSGADFRLVCELADFEPAFIVRAVDAAQRRGWQFAHQVLLDRGFDEALELDADAAEI